MSHAPSEATPARAASSRPPAGPPPLKLRVLVPVTSAFAGKLRLRRSSGTLDTEGLERVLSKESLQAIALARQLQAHGADIVAVHVDVGGGEDVLRQALAHGIDQGILIEGAGDAEADASTRAATIADVYRQNGPFDAVIGPARSDFGGFTGAIAAVAGRLDLPCVVGVSSIQPEGSGFRIHYESLFGDYDLAIPRPCAIMAGDIAPSHPTAWGIHDAYRVRGVLRVHADQFARLKPNTKRLRIEPVPKESRTVEEVDGETLVRRMRSRALVADKGKQPKAANAAADAGGRKPPAAGAPKPDDKPVPQAAKPASGPEALKAAPAAIVPRPARPQGASA